MLLACFFILFAYACFRGLINDNGMYIFVLLVGFFQDPARKLTPDEPVQMTILVGVVILAVLVRQILLQRRSITAPFTQWSSSLWGPITVYLVLVTLQGIHSLVRFQSIILTALGAIFYIAPLIAITVGYRFFHNFDNVRAFLKAYSLLGVMVALTVLMSYAGFDSPLFGEVGSGLIIYDQGTVLKAHSGLLRSSEIAAWHLTASVCFLIILLFDRFSLGSLVWASLAAVIILSAMVLTGRRKSFVQLIIFIMLYLPLLQYYRSNLSSKILSIYVLATLIMVAFFLLSPSLQGTTYDLYLARGISVFDDIGGRATQLGLGSIVWAYKLHGVLGSGLGVSSQGAQHFIEGYDAGAGEGGLGKIVSELGLFALPILAWVGLNIASHINRVLRALAHFSPETLSIFVGIIAVLMANLPSFIVASQAFGDVFVLLILGLLVSALFAVPKQLSFYLSTKAGSSAARPI